MIDVEPLIRKELARLVPAPAANRIDWADVLRRSGARPPHVWARRPFAFALAAALAVLLAAAALATTLGGFDDWLTGAPGKPASEGAQKRFRAANGRSWAAFPTSTELRELIRTDVDGREYVLYGFRSGNSLCLKLAAAKVARQPQVCAPRSVIARTSAPLVVFGGWTFDDRAARPTASASFGIVADGVKAVRGQATDGDRRALIGGNAYLFVEHEPNTGSRVLAISAVDSRGRRATVRLNTSPATDRRPGGPTRIEARIKDPKVGWQVRGEKRGFQALGGIRFVKPDPLSDMAVGFSGLCLYSLSGSGRFTGQSCGGLFTRGPINALIGCNICGEFAEVRGVAADGVERVAIFLADGTRQAAVPLRHNLFATRVGWRQFPIRIVGYDARGRVAATQLWGELIVGPRVPPAAKRLRTVLRVAGPNGAVAQLFVGRRVRGFDCWRVDFSTGQKRSGCNVPHTRGLGFAVQPAGRDLFVVGQVSHAVARVELRFSDGNKAAARPVAGHFVLAIPRDHVSRRRQRAFVVSFDRDENRRARERIFFRLP